MVAKLIDYGRPEHEYRERLSIQTLDVVPFDTELAYQAGFLRSSTRQGGLSLGDRACLALAKSSASAPSHHRRSELAELVVRDHYSAHSVNRSTRPQPGEIGQQKLSARKGASFGSILLGPKASGP